MDCQKALILEIPLRNYCTHISFVATTQKITTIFSFQTIPFDFERTITASKNVVMYLNYSFEYSPISVCLLFRDEESEEYTKSNYNIIQMLSSPKERAMSLS
jgi:hypothetical protein